MGTILLRSNSEQLCEGGIAFCRLSVKTEGENAMPDMLMWGLTSTSLAPAAKESKHVIDVVLKQLGSSTTNDNKDGSLKRQGGLALQ